ncbi:hypothetical protein V8E53_004751 [Lactarius tabidus]
MASSGAELDVEAQISGATVPLPTNIELEDDPPTNPPNPQPPSSADPQPQATNTVELLNVNPPAPQTANNSEVQQDENLGDPSDGLWSLYLTEAEKQDKVVIESWKGDTEGIIVFTGLFSATVATFIIESLQNLSPDSGDTTNALLAQITQQLVNISSGAPLTSVVAQSGQSFKPTASAIRVNVLWFLSLILSLNCALSATLMQQWARRYQELAQRPGAFHRRGRMRAYIFDGISRFGMARAVSTMPTLLHLSVFLFLTGLVEFLFPIHPIVAYATLGCIMAFALPYVVLTVLPNIYLNCPYGTPLSSMTWRISQFSAIVFLQTILGIRKSFSKSWSFAMRQAPESPGLQKWRESLENQVKMRRQWFSQGIRRSVELSVYKADSTVVTNALVWTLAALDEDKEIEDFAARIPGFFNSRVVPDATSAALSLMSHQPAIDPVFGSRLCDLLKTCTPEASVLDEKMRKNRLRVSLNCLWHFGRAYNQVIQPLPAYFPNSLIPEITRRVQTEEDSGVRMLGRCFESLMVNKLAADIDSRNSPITDAELACLPAILGIKSRDVVNQPGAVALANLIMFMFEGEDTSILLNKIPLDLLDVVQQTLGVLSQPLSPHESTKLQLYQPVPIINVSDGNFERILLCRLHELLSMSIAATSLDKEVRTSCLQMCLRGLWYFERALNQIGNSMDLPSCIYIPFLNPEVAGHIRFHTDPTVYVIGTCVLALVTNMLATDINGRTLLVNEAELACLSVSLGTDIQHVSHWLDHPGAIQFANMVFLIFNICDDFRGVIRPDCTSVLDSVRDINSWSPTSYVLDVICQTFSILSQGIPGQLGAEMRLDLTDTLVDVSKGTSTLSHVIPSRVLGMFLKNLWNYTRAYIEHGNSKPLPSYIFIALTHPMVTRCIPQRGDTAPVILRCIEALVVNKVAADINTRTPVTDASLSAILGADIQHVTHLLNYPGAIQFVNLLFLVSDDIFLVSDDMFFVSVDIFLESDEIYHPQWNSTSDVLDMVRETFSILSQGLPAQLDAEMRLDLTDSLADISKGTSRLSHVTRRVLGMCLKNLWNLTKAHIECGNPVSLPSYIYTIFTHPEITRRIRREGDIATHLIRQCVGALVVHKLATDVGTRALPVNDVELASISSILDSDSRDVRLCLTQPGIVELVNLASLALGRVGSLNADDAALNLYEVTLGILSQALPAAENAEISQGQAVPLPNIFDDKLEHAIVSHLHSFLKICVSGTSPLTEEVRTSCLRMLLKTLWNSGKAHQLSSDPLPPHYSLMLASPELIHHFQTEQDPVARLMGRFFGALVVNKLVDTIESPVSLTGQKQNAELACISAILSAGHTEGLLSPHHLRIINFEGVVSLMLGEIDTFTEAGMPEDMPNTAQVTLYTLANRFHDRRFAREVLPMDQRQLLQEINSDLQDAWSYYQRKDEAVDRLERLQQKLKKLLRTVH